MLSPQELVEFDAVNMTFAYKKCAAPLLDGSTPSQSQQR
jgi:hypothetical protein